MKRLFYILSSIVLAIIVVACIDDNTTDIEDVVRIGDTLPTFTVTTSNGVTVSSEQLSCGISLVMFFHTGCPDCRATLPGVQQLYEKYGSDVQFLLISREDAQASVAEYWSQNNLTMPYSAQNDRRIYELFARKRVPRIYINQNGVIRSIFTDNPTPDYQKLKEALTALI